MWEDGDIATTKSNRVKKKKKNTSSQTIQLKLWLPRPRVRVTWMSSSGGVHVGSVRTLLSSGRVHVQLRTPRTGSWWVYTTFWDPLGERAPHVRSRSPSTGTQRCDRADTTNCRYTDVRTEPTLTPCDDGIYVTRTLADPATIIWV